MWQDTPGHQGDSRTHVLRGLRKVNAKPTCGTDKRGSHDAQSSSSGSQPRGLQTTPLICTSMKPGARMQPPQSLCSSATRRSSKNSFSGSRMLPPRTHRSSLRTERGGGSHHRPRSPPGSPGPGLRPPEQRPAPQDAAVGELDHRGPRRALPAAHPEPNRAGGAGFRAEFRPRAWPGARDSQLTEARPRDPGAHVTNAVHSDAATSSRVARPSAPPSRPRHPRAPGPNKRPTPRNPVTSENFIGHGSAPGPSGPNTLRHGPGSQGCRRWFHPTRLRANGNRTTQQST